MKPHRFPAGGAKFAFCVALFAFPAPWCWSQAVTLEEDLTAIAPLSVPASPPLPPRDVAPEQPFVPDATVPDLPEENAAEFLIGPDADPSPLDVGPPPSEATDGAAAQDAGTVQNAEFQPDQPGGFSLGNFLGDFLSLGSSGDPDSKDRFRIGVFVRGGYDSNVLASSVDPIGTLFSTAGASAAYSIGTQRFEFSFRGSGGITVYQNRPGGRSDFNGRVDLTGLYRFDRRLTTSAALGLAYLSQPDPGLVGGTSSLQGDYLVTDGTLNVAYLLLPTVTVRPAYRLYAIRYQDEIVNENSGFTSQTFSLTGEWLYRPTTTLTAEYRYNPVTYYLEGEGSQGQILTLGFVQKFSPRFTLTFQGGAEYRILENPEQGGSNDYLGPFAEGALEYQFAPASLITGELRYGTEPSGTGGVTIRRTFRASIGIEHSISGRWTLQTGLIYENSYYDQPDIIPDITQDSYYAYVGLTYKVSNALSLTARYDYTSLFSSSEFGDYNRGISSLSVEVSF